MKFSYKIYGAVKSCVPIKQLLVLTQEKNDKILVKNYENVSNLEYRHDCNLITIQSVN